MTLQQARDVAKVTSKGEPINIYAVVKPPTRYTVVTVHTARMRGFEILERWHAGERKDGAQ